MKKAINIIVICAFFMILSAVDISYIIIPDEEVSATERRNLEQKPVCSGKTIFSGEYMDSLEDYFLDQFPLRERMRKIKTAVRCGIFGQKDSNGLYVIDESIYKMEKKTNEDQICLATEKINYICEKYLEGMNVYYSIVPDKNYFVARQNGYPSIDYEKLTDTVQKNISDIKYIDIFNSLSIDDYYRTDPHWKQENLSEVVNTLLSAMNAGSYDKNEYKENKLDAFSGAYAGQYAMNTNPDSLIYLTDKSTEDTTLLNVETNSVSGVYTTEKYNGIDGYDLFMNGPCAILIAENQNSESDKELILFRDSFGSSIAPLMLNNYKKITLVDLRYVSGMVLDKFVTFNNQDVLFLYSTLILNNGSVLK